MIRNLKTKQWNPLSFRLFSLASMISHLSRPYGACVKCGSGKHMFGLSLFCPSPQSPRRAKKDSNIPSPGRTSSVKCPTPGPTTTIKSPPHALPPRPAGIILIGALKFSFFNVCEKMQHHGRSLRMLAVDFRYERKQWGIQGRDPGARPPPWSLDQTEARRAEENFLWDRLPPHLISGSGWYMHKRIMFYIQPITSKIVRCEKGLSKLPI